MRYKKRLIISILLLWFLARNEIFAQIKQEQEEKILEVKKLEKRRLPSKLSSRVGVFVGYDSNVKLSGLRKGDIFQEFLYSLDFRQLLGERVKFRFNYDLDVYNYNEFTDLSNILNHFRLELSQKYPLGDFGGGYDLGILYYHHNQDGDFIFHKGFLYWGKKLAKTYHKIQLEYGYKDYLNALALGDTISTYQDKERLDRRRSIFYSIYSPLTPRLHLRYKIKFATNDSNARYVDFYDYICWRHLLAFDYKLSRELKLRLNLSYIRKEYSSRTVTSRDYEQRDNLYSATMGLIYQLNKENFLSLYYAYRENSSNDSLSEYTESVIICGWQYNF